MKTKLLITAVMLTTIAVGCSQTQIRSEDKLASVEKNYNVRSVASDGLEDSSASTVSQGAAMKCYEAAYLHIYKEVYALKPGDRVGFFGHWTEKDIQEEYHRQSYDSMWRNNLLTKKNEPPFYDVYKARGVMGLFNGTNYNPNGPLFGGGNMSALGLPGVYAPHMNKAIKNGLLQEVQNLPECQGIF